MWHPSMNDGRGGALRMESGQTPLQQFSKKLKKKKKKGEIGQICWVNLDDGLGY